MHFVVSCLFYFIFFYFNFFYLFYFFLLDAFHIHVVYLYNLFHCYVFHFNLSLFGALVLFYNFNVYNVCNVLKQCFKRAYLINT